MKFSEYSPLALRTLNTSLPPEKQMQHALLGMCTEVGELADDVKRHFVYGQDFDKVNAAVEIGDYAWYFNLWCHENYIDPRAVDKAMAVELNLNENRQEDALLDTVILLFSMSGAATIPEDQRGASNQQVMVQLVRLLMVCAAEIGTTVEACLDTNIAKLAKRYGDKYSDYAALNRDVAGERLVEEGKTLQ